MAAFKRHAGSVLIGFVRQAALNEAAARLPKAERTKVRPNPPPVAVPDDLAMALLADARAKATFDRLSPSQRREYVDGIVEAKRAERRERRIAQAIALLSEGKTRNWKHEGKR